jgi:hypothetical protein
VPELSAAVPAADDDADAEIECQVDPVRYFPELRAPVVVAVLDIRVVQPSSERSTPGFNVTSN